MVLAAIAIHLVLHVWYWQRGKQRDNCYSPSVKGVVLAAWIKRDNCCSPSYYAPSVEGAVRAPCRKRDNCKKEEQLLFTWVATAIDVLMFKLYKIGTTASQHG